MNSGPTSERVYDALKQWILHRHFRPGDRLDPAALADALGSSVTPVRDALNRLSGEGLVETRVSDGFHLPNLSDPALQDLYEWNGQLLLMALKGGPLATAMRQARPGDLQELDVSNPDIASRAAALFAAIAFMSGNGEHRRAILAANERLYPARLVEAELFPNCATELSEIGSAVETGDPIGLRRMIALYHRRRRRAAADIVRGLYRES